MIHKIIEIIFKSILCNMIQFNIYFLILCFMSYKVYEYNMYDIYIFLKKGSQEVCRFLKDLDLFVVFMNYY